MIQVHGNSGGKVDAAASTFETESPTITSTPQMILTTAFFSALFSFLFTGLSDAGILHFHDGLRYHAGHRAEDQHVYLRFESDEQATMMIHSKLEQTRRALQGNENGIVFACKKTNSGDVRIVSALSDCKKSFETGLQWNVQGPPGK